jgi:hypothetical protein
MFRPGGRRRVALGSGSPGGPEPGRRCSDAGRRLTITPRVPKYEPLREFLTGMPLGQKQVTLGFRRLEELLGDALPPSAMTYEQWWRGGRVKRGRIDANWQDQVQQRAWEDAGWTVEDLDLLLKNVTFRRR